MLKLLVALSFLSCSLVSWANPLLPGMTVKERLRLSLWYEGVEFSPKSKTLAKKQYPEEIERALRKM
jgi:hypothetical protein